MAKHRLKATRVWRLQRYMSVSTPLAPWSAHGTACGGGSSGGSRGTLAACCVRAPVLVSHVSITLAVTNETNSAYVELVSLFIEPACIYTAGRRAPGDPGTVHSRQAPATPLSCSATLGRLSVGHGITISGWCCHPPGCSARSSSSRRVRKMPKSRRVACHSKEGWAG